MLVVKEREGHNRENQKDVILHEEGEYIEGRMRRRLASRRGGV